jgi:hypothetical protein
MPRVNKMPLGFSSSGRSKSRIVTIAAGAVLFGTIVGGASALGVVMAIVQPPAHDDRADAGSGGAATSFDAPAQPRQAQATPQPEQTAAAQQPVPSTAPSKTWPDALSARTDHGRADPIAATPTPDVATAARDLSGSRQSDEHIAEDQNAPPASEPTVAERAPWPNPVSPSVKAMRKHAVVAAEPAAPPLAPPPASAAPTTPSVAAADDTKTTPTNKMRDDGRKPRLTQQQQPPQSRDAMNQNGDDRNQSGDDRAPPAYPPRQRFIILAPPPSPPPERDAGMDRDHGNGLFGLFDFAGHDHWNGDRWGNDRWHDDER